MCACTVYTYVVRTCSCVYRCVHIYCVCLCRVYMLHALCMYVSCQRPCSTCVHVLHLGALCVYGVHVCVVCTRVYCVCMSRVYCARASRLSIVCIVPCHTLHTLAHMCRRHIHVCMCVVYLSHAHVCCAHVTRVYHMCVICMCEYYIGIHIVHACGCV